MAQSVVVSCYRGPWKSVIVDRPNDVFVESLMEYGYTEVEATGIGNVICRDEDLVDDEAALAAAMQDLLVSTPPR